MKRLTLLLLFIFIGVLCATTVTVTQGNGQVSHSMKGTSSDLNTLGGIANFLIKPYQDSVKIDYLSLSPLEVYYAIPAGASSPPTDDIVKSTDDPLMGPVFNYPNPFTLDEGTHFGYQLRDDIDITIRLYNIYGHKIWSKDYKAGQDEGAIGGKYNKVPFNRSEISNYKLAAGIYFYLVLNDKSILGKGKMAIKP
jgi:hypothetical protein